ncbi:receptor-like protein EIX1 [Ziziphus jujuba]|uniref:Receptor-like protein EIX1 n=1 Tax=Ziziphus jujuba TaxID=326968 RepID=A0ABM3ZRZ0_ZIZJJ|nr:receptor-like protein EIX1 [Ziziphus jujuba]
MKKGLYDVTYSGLMFARSTVSNTNSTITTQYVSSLDLSNNHLCGIVPSSIGNLHFLEFLVLSNNGLSGELPSYLKNCTSLASLDLGDNKFSRKLPSWIGETMPHLLILRMRSNFFTGDIPLMFYSPANLHILDLSYNSLSGHMPNCIGILSGLLPMDIVNLKSLETLDLSNHKLFGPIPLSMPSLTFLNHLNLSYNTLSRKIPTANQFQTLEDPSIYQGNAGLFGKPLPTDCTGSIIDTLGEKEEEDGDIGDPLIEQLGFFISMFLGFFVGFWGVCGTLIIKRSWRDACFHFVDRVKEHFVGKKKNQTESKTALTCHIMYCIERL